MSLYGQVGLAASGEAAVFRLGDMQVRPASREIEGPGGVAMLEPRVLQVLLALAEARGEVLGREALMARCWSGLVVGEDSLTRAIGELRKALRTVDGGVSIETIPKTGYRLRNEPPPADAGAATDRAIAAVPLSSVSRRRVLLAAGVGVAVVGGGAAWWLSPGSDEARAGALVDQATTVMRDDRWGPVDPIVLLREAIRLHPGGAKAWGKLALARRDLVGAATDPPEARAIADCRDAAKEALARDPAQADALVALATLDPIYTDWLAVEERLMALSKRFPDHEDVMVALGSLYAATGRTNDCQRVRARLVAIEPLSPTYAAQAAYAHWLAGNHGEMNRLADHALRTWPGNGLVWDMRMFTLGFTGRAAEALEMIERKGSLEDFYPPLLGEAHVAAFKAQTGAGSVEAAVAAAVAAGPWRQSTAAAAIPLLASLGAADQAFALANAYFLGRGPIKMPNRFGAPQPSAREARRRETEYLFRPTARSLWPDARFAPLCGEIGLMDYWRAAGVRPDLLGTRPFSI